MWLPLILMQAGAPALPPTAQLPPAPPAPASAQPSTTPPPAASPAPYPYPYPYAYPPPGPYPYGTQPSYPPGYAWPAAPPPTPAPPPEPRKPPSWMGTVTFGVGFIHKSDEVQLLEQDGYGMDARVWFQLDAAAMLGEHVGLGGWAAIAGNSWSAVNGGPDLTQVVYFIGPHVPIVVGSHDFSFVLSPRLGLAYGSLYFAHNERSQTVPAWGCDMGLLWRGGHIGMTFGFLYAPADPPGDLGRHYDLGSINFGITGVIDG